MAQGTDTKVEKRFANRKFYRVNFAEMFGPDLSHADFRSTTCAECDFTNCDLSYANCEGANFWGSNFTGAKLYRTNFKDAVLEKTVMKPKDCFGMTLTMTCDTVRDMEVSEMWWNVWIFMALLMKLPTPEMEPKVITMLGTERYMALRRLFDMREF